MRPLLLATLALLASGAISAAKSAPAATFPPHVLPNTEVRPLPRASNGRHYQLFVALPPDYGTSGKKYPVLYLCDGYWDFTLINGFYGNLIYDRATPHFIIVGLGYQNTSTNAGYDVLRRHDYTPAPDRDDPKAERTGHAAGFLKVVEHEIIPFIEKNYRADPSWRVLSGNSLGGLFSLYAMLARPGLFQGHIACSPAAHPALFELEETFAATGARLPTRLFMTGAGEEWPDFLADIRRFHERLQSRHHAGFQYRWRLIEGEGHTSTKAESFTRGLRFVFEPLKPR